MRLSPSRSPFDVASGQDREAAVEIDGFDGLAEDDLEVAAALFERNLAHHLGEGGRGEWAYPVERSASLPLTCFRSPSCSVLEAAVCPFLGARYD